MNSAKFGLQDTKTAETFFKLCAEEEMGPCRFSHLLSESEAFSLTEIAKLSQRLPRDSVEYQYLQTDIVQDADSVRPHELPIEEVVRSIEEADAWLILKNIEQDPSYRDLLLALLDQHGAEDVTKLRDVRAFLFVTSAGAVTPFHLDYERNLYFHIHGEKDFHLFDNREFRYLCAADLEMYPGKHRNQHLDQDLKEEAERFALNPGDGLHVPYMWPHFVATSKHGPAVSLALTWKTRLELNHNALLAANAMLRSMGWAQPDPGRFLWFDWMKSTGVRLTYLFLSPLRKSQRMRIALRKIFFGRKANYYLDQEK